MSNQFESSQQCKVLCTYDGRSQKFTSEELMSFHFNAIKIILKTSVGVWITVGELIDISLLVETKRKRHDVILTMLRTSIVIDILVWHTNPITVKCNIGIHTC